MKFQIVSDSSCDLGREQAQALGVTLVSYYVSLDGETSARDVCFAAGAFAVGVLFGFPSDL